MTLAGTKLRSWSRRLESAKRKVEAVSEEIYAGGDSPLVDKMVQANCDLGECLSILGATIDACRDPRGKRADKRG